MKKSTKHLFRESSCKIIISTISTGNITNGKNPLKEVYFICCDYNLNIKPDETFFLYKQFSIFLYQMYFFLLFFKKI